FLNDDILINIENRKRRSFFIGDVDATCLFVQGKGFGAWAGGEPANHLELGDIDDVDHVVIATCNIKQRVVGAEGHIAWATGGPEVFDDLVVFGVEHDDVVRLLIAHKDQTGILGSARHCSAHDQQEESCAASHCGEHLFT